MHKYTYKAIKDKKLISGGVEASDENEAADKLKEKGYEILSIKDNISDFDEEIEKRKLSLMERFTKVKKAEKVFLYKNFATMLKAGLPLLETIDLLRESIKNPKLEEVLSKLKYDVESGNYISASLASYPNVFSSSEIAMIRAGEIGGTLPQSFFGLFEDADSEYKLQKDIKGAMMYPAIILSILLFVAILLLVFVLPQLTGFFMQANIDVPRMTKITMAISDFIRKNIILISIFFISITIVLKILIDKVEKAKVIFDKIIIKLPWIGKQFKLFFIHKITRMLGLLIRSGVPILQALDIVEKSMGHHGYAQSIREIKADVKKGGKLSDSIERYENLYPPFVSRMLKVGDRTGNTSEALDNISVYYRDELQEALDNISTIIEPILMVCLGVGVAFIAISVLIPLYSIVSGINQMKK